MKSITICTDVFIHPFRFTSCELDQIANDHDQDANDGIQNPLEIFLETPEVKFEPP
ncbi:hypothetical protein [Galbibacter sp.]|uniref:hypothetical protein n=1 Tax=Galbibacter sp. TaxID=2918471 RepID=UPI003A8E3CB1